MPFDDELLDRLAVVFIEAALDSVLSEGDSMSNVVAIPPWQMCECGSDIATFPVAGGHRCESCAQALAQIPRASIDLSPPSYGGGPSLDETLRRLTEESA